MGHLFVGARLLAESPMRDYPLTPMRESDLQLLLLKPQVSQAHRTNRPPLITNGPEQVCHVWKIFAPTLPRMSSSVSLLARAWRP